MSGSVTKNEITNAERIMNEKQNYRELVNICESPSQNEITSTESTVDAKTSPSTDKTKKCNAGFYILGLVIVIGVSMGTGLIISRCTGCQSETHQIQQLMQDIKCIQNVLETIVDTITPNKSVIRDVTNNKGDAKGPANYTCSVGDFLNERLKDSQRPIGEIGPAGFKGMPVNKGQVGENGHPREKGHPGDKGPTGNKGPDEDKGLIGNKRQTGDKGPTGNKGQSGDKGPTGNKRQSGDKGPSGNKGQTGSMEPTGQKGLTEHKRKTGDNGPSGDKEDKGLTGHIGPTGHMVPTRDKGRTEDNGPSAYRGTSCLTIYENHPGLPGDKGIKGEKGLRGEQGIKGENGLCNRNWILFDQYCYYFAYILESWPDAQKACQRRGGNLVKIYNAAVNSFIKSSLKGDTWMGAHDSKLESVFRWISDGSFLQYSNFNPGEPNDKHNSEDCVEFRQENEYRWNDDECYTYKYYVCQK